MANFFENDVAIVTRDEEHMRHVLLCMASNLDANGSLESDLEELEGEGPVTNLFEKLKRDISGSYVESLCEEPEGEGMSEAAGVYLAQHPNCWVLELVYATAYGPNVDDLERFEEQLGSDEDFALAYEGYDCDNAECCEFELDCATKTAGGLSSLLDSADARLCSLAEAFAAKRFKDSIEEYLDPEEDE